MRKRIVPLTLSGVIAAACVTLALMGGCTSVTPAEQATYDAIKANSDAALDEACRMDKLAHPGGKILADAALAATGNGAIIPLASGLDAAAYGAFQASCDERASTNAAPIVPAVPTVTPGS